MTSECIVVFDGQSYEIKTAATPAVDFELQDYASADDLADYLFDFPTNATFEPDFWLLDGNYKLLPAVDDGIKHGVVSAEMSDESGEFAAPLETELDFGGEASWNEEEDFEDTPIGLSEGGTGTGLARTGAAALEGSWGGEVAFDGTNAEYWYSTNPDGETYFYLEFLFDPNSSTFGDPREFTLASGEPTSGTDSFNLNLRRASGQYYLRLHAVTDTGSLDYYSLIGIGDEPVKISIKFKASSSPGANDGEMSLFLDDILALSYENIDNDTKEISSFMVGVVSALVEAGTGSFYVDSIKWSNDFGSAVSVETGVTLYFDELSENYPTELTISFLDIFGLEIFSDTYYPSSGVLAIEQAVANFAKIVITVPGTNNPYRYFRFTRIDYDKLTIFEGESVKTAEQVREIDPSCTSLPIHTFDVRLHSDEDTFNPINPTGIYESIVQYLKLYVYAVVNGETRFLGVFFLDTWDNVSDNEIEFHCVDLLGMIGDVAVSFRCEKEIYTGYYHGVFNDYGFVSGVWSTLEEYLITGGSEENYYSGLFYHTREEILGDTLDYYGIPYTFDAALDITETMTGWIREGTLREGLQQFCLLLGAYLDCSDGVLNFLPIKLADTSSVDQTILTSQKITPQSIELKPLIAEVQVKYYTLLGQGGWDGDLYEVVFNEEVETGTFKTFISVDNPQYTWYDTSSTATFEIVEFHANWFLITVSVAGVIKLGSNLFSQTIKDASLQVDDYESILYPRVVVLEDVRIIHADNYEEVMQRLFDYYQQRLKTEFSVQLSEVDIGVGDMVLVDSLYEQQIKGCVEKMIIDVAGGMLAKVTVVGEMYEA